MLCVLIMHYAKHSPPTGQTVLVLCIFNLEPRNPHQQACVSLHENPRQEAGARNLPRMAQGRAQSAQWQAERGRRARSHRCKVSAMCSRRPTSNRCHKRILKTCGENIEWRGLVLFGLYLGQRLGDLAKLTWRAVDLDSGEIAFTAPKTGRRIVLPLVQPLSDYLASLPASDNPNAYIFPRAASAKRTAS